ncbi:hypothetical protein ES703_86385 [subsurface metagenome]
MLEVSNIDTFYGKIQALWGVSLKIEKAEIVALVAEPLYDAEDFVHHER